MAEEEESGEDERGQRGKILKSTLEGKEKSKAVVGKGGSICGSSRSFHAAPKKVRLPCTGIYKQSSMYSRQQFRWDRELNRLCSLSSIIVFILVLVLPIGLIGGFGLLGFLLRKLGIDLDRDLWSKQVSTDSTAAQKTSQEGKMYRRIFIAVIDTHRPVVLQFYLHHCLKDAILDLIRDVGTAHFIVEIVVHLARSLGIGRVVEVGLIAFHLAVESELGDYADISYRTIMYNKEIIPQRTSPSISWTFFFHCATSQY